MAHGPEEAEAALTTSDAVATEVGSGPVDAVAAGCGLARLSLFFDGTGNSRDHADGPRPGIPGRVNSWYTNVDLLQQLYQRVPASKNATITVEGEERPYVAESFYLRGIGARADGSVDGIQGFAQGIGPEGVSARVEEAIGQAQLFLRNLTGDVVPCDIWLDAIGFSRGAAAARDFANAIHDGRFSYDGAKQKVKFLGLFDTVSSIMAPGSGDGRYNSGNSRGGTDHVTGTVYPPVTLNTGPNVAEKTFQIVALDEIRADFPLTHIRGREIGVVGAHSDIGGGYFSVDPGKFTYSPEKEYPWLMEFFTERWGTENVSLETYEVKSLLGSKYMETGTTLTTNAARGIQHVTLRLMHDAAKAAQMPLKDIGSSIACTINGSTKSVSVELSSDLAGYLEELRSGAASPVTESAIRHRYAHFSCQKETGYYPTDSGKRASSTL